MKILALSSLLTITLCCNAAETSITTASGKTYNHISFQRADSDGLYIEYTPAGGGVGSAKLKFSNLSTELQSRYGYNAEQARKYEGDAAKASQQWVKDSIAAQSEARRLLREQQWKEDELLNDRIRAIAELRTADAVLVWGPAPQASTPWFAPWSAAFGSSKPCFVPFNFQTESANALFPYLGR